MSISLVIPAYNEEKQIGECLDAVLKNAPGKFFEIIVVDNASTDKTKEVALQRKGVRVVYEPNKGLTHARECGRLASSGDLIAYIDADTRMPVGWVDKVEKVFRTSPDVVALSGPSHFFDSTAWQNFVLIFLWWLTAPLAYRITGYMIYGAHFVAKREALQAIGGFDKNIRFYGEDTDIAKRLSKQGKVMFRMDFLIYTSARRFQHAGFLKTNFIYMMNFIWPVLFDKPFGGEYRDVRPESISK
jgi:glycosyltransferase involved in cell wall biosynthesis